MTTNGSNNNNSAGADRDGLRLDCSSAAGAPTLTTPTLTPTTLRNIEQMFLEAAANECQPEQPVDHVNAAHFVPPPISVSVSSLAPPPPLPGPTSVEVPPPLPGPPGPVLVLPGPPLPTLTNQVPLNMKSEIKSEPASIKSSPPKSKSTKKRATKSSSKQKQQQQEQTVITNNDDLGGGGGEDQKKVLRRERNKEAAARCRKRRLDLTLSLQDEVDRLEALQTEMQREVKSLEAEQEKLKSILDNHGKSCTKSDAGDKDKSSSKTSVKRSSNSKKS